MSDYGVAILIIIGIWAIGFAIGYITGMEHPSKGEIILWVEGPHKCKGIPRKGGWHTGTQWKCNTCGDIWEVVDTYDGIERGREFQRITKKGKKK